jgi:putative transcriptional regulator
MQAAIIPKPGSLLISDPFLQDPNFSRTVVLICEHQPAGSFGLVLNQPMNLLLSDIVPSAPDLQLPVLCGGPVANDTLHFIHRQPDLLEGSILLKDNIAWSGNFIQIIQYLQSGRLKQSDILFFLGYSGWGEGQLLQELQEKTWITSEISSSLLFDTEPKVLWQNALLKMQGEYVQMANYPIDPQLN